MNKFRKITEATCKELIKTWQDKPKPFIKSKSTSKSNFLKKVVTKTF